MRRRAATAAAAAAAVLSFPCCAAGAGGVRRRAVSRAALVESVNRMPGVLWTAALGVRMLGTAKDTIDEEARVPGVLPGYREHLRALAARGEVRRMSSVDFAMQQLREEQLRLDYLRERDEARREQERGRRQQQQRQQQQQDGARHRPPHAAASAGGSSSVVPAVVSADSTTHSVGTRLLPLPDPRRTGEPGRRSGGGQKPTPLGGADWAQQANQLSLPRDFDSAIAWPHCSHVINNILDQGNCGCCWAFCVAEVASDRLCIATRGRVAVPLSTQNLCFCSTAERRGCDGGWTTQAWFYLRTMGVVTGQQQRFDRASYPPAVWDLDSFGNRSFCAPYTLPHCHHHGPTRDDPFPAEGTLGCPDVPVGGSPQCPQQCAPSASAPHDNFLLDTFSFQGDIEQYVDEGAIMAAIARCGPVTATIDAYDDFEHYVSGIYHRTKNASSRGGHAIKITGYGEENGVKYWKVANSWNPHWGEEGFVRVLRGVNEIGIEGEVTASSCNVQWTTTSSAF